MIQYKVKIIPDWFPEGCYKQEIYVCADETELMQCINSIYSHCSYEIVSQTEAP